MRPFVKAQPPAGRHRRKSPCCLRRGDRVHHPSHTGRRRTDLRKGTLSGWCDAGRVCLSSLRVGRLFRSNGSVHTIAWTGPTCGNQLLDTQNERTIHRTSRYQNPNTLSRVRGRGIPCGTQYNFVQQYAATLVPIAAVRRSIGTCRQYTARIAQDQRATCIMVTFR